MVLAVVIIIMMINIYGFRPVVCLKSNVNLKEIDSKKVELST